MWDWWQCDVDVGDRVVAERVPAQMHKAVDGLRRKARRSLRRVAERAGRVLRRDDLVADRDGDC